MKRRQFSAMLATATFSLGGLGSAAADASAESAEPLELEDVSVELGSVTASISQATFEFQESTMQLQLEGWSMEGDGRSLAIDETSVTVEDVDEETYSAVRSAMVEAYTERSVSALLTVISDGTIPESSPVEVSAGPIEKDGQTVADQVTATGTAGEVVPEGTESLAEDGLSLGGITGLGSSMWSQLTVERGDSQLALEDVVMEREGTSLVVSASEGEAALPDRTLELSEVTMDVMPPETIPEEHVAFASELRQLASEGSVGVSDIESAAADSGVTVSNTSDAVESAQFVLSVGEASEGGETLVSDFQTSGTLAELMQVLQTRL